MIGAFEPWAVDLMAEMSVAAQHPLNWNVMPVTASTLSLAMERLEASSEAKRRGGKVVGLTIPMAISTRLSFASGFVLDAIPGWGKRSCCCHGRRSWRSCLIHAGGSASIVRPRNPVTRYGRWPTGRRRSSTTSWQPTTSSTGVARSARSLLNKVVYAFDVLCDIAVADDLLTSFGDPPPVDTKEDWEARWPSGATAVRSSADPTPGPTSICSQRSTTPPCCSNMRSAATRSFPWKRRYTS